MRWAIDIEKIITWASPWERRTSFELAWWKGLMSHIKSTHDLFVGKVTKWDYDLKYAPGYLIQLRERLIDQFGAGIEIVNNKQDALPFFAYELDNNANLFSYELDNQDNPFVSGLDAYDPGFVSFTVKIPVDTIVNPEDENPFWSYALDDGENLFTKSLNDADNEVYSFGLNLIDTGFATLLYNPDQTSAVIQFYKPFNKTFELKIVA